MIRNENQSGTFASGPLSGNQQEASDLALNLKAGSLPAGVRYEQEDTVGASLGADSIRNGFAAGIAGVLAVIVAMLIYYKKSGLNATLALVLNAISPAIGGVLVKPYEMQAGRYAHEYRKYCT